MTREEHLAKLTADGVLHNNGWTVDSVGVGWKDLVEPLIHVCNLADVVVLQIKEKFGTLRFYVGGAPEWVNTLIDLADAASSKTCEDCGAKHGYGWYTTNEEIAKGKTVKRRSGGWIRTLCDECATKAGYSLEEEEEGESL